MYPFFLHECILYRVYIIVIIFSQARLLQEKRTNKMEDGDGGELNVYVFKFVVCSFCFLLLIICIIIIYLNFIEVTPCVRPYAITTVNSHFYV